MKRIMTRAWEIAKEGQRNFGGKVSEYFAIALKMAWEEAKNGITVDGLDVIPYIQSLEEVSHHIVIESKKRFGKVQFAWGDEDWSVSANVWEKYKKRRIYVNGSNGENLGYYEFDKNGFFKSYKGLNTFDENIYTEFMFAIERKLLERNNWMKQQAAA